MDFKKIEQKWQNEWKKARIFEPKVDKKKKKFFFTTPYPYISGSLHIGHGRAVVESDIYCRFLRMQGFNVLYPLAFHITGTPILGISTAIEQGDQKKIKLYKSYVKKYVKSEKEINKIVQSFKDPQNIVDFFIPKMMDEYSSLGLSIDWTRRFTTGDPDYNKFITWQFMKYKEKNYLVKGSYHVLFCPRCDNAVAEDDIQDADTNPVKKQDFMWGKFRLITKNEKNSDLILMAGTTRPDAFYGQTNLWVDPKTTYKIVKVKNEKWVVGPLAVDKIEQQYEKPKVIGEISAKELIGKWVRGPLVDYDIYILPASFINANVGSGIVFSALEDPVDLFQLKKLQTNPDLIKKYNLDSKVIAKLKPISIINVSGMGENLGEEIGKEFGVKSADDKEKIEAAKSELNKRVFRKGVMKKNCGACAGKTVQEAQNYLKKYLTKKGDAVMFYETSREAFCRCGEKIIVSKLKDQWFLDFNTKGWKDLAYKCLEKMELMPESSRKLFLNTFKWLDKRPCARKRGLGTQLPFDKEWMIESLSDSTIYMSFYTIKNLINKYKIEPKHLCYEFFDYVYLGKGDIKKVSKKTKISEKILKEFRLNFDYWYPNDQRHTFMAHLSNHLSFFIFAHAGIFPEKYWPKKISLHGFVLSEGAKMSKSKGNVISLLDVKNKYGADVFRAYISTATNIEGTFNWKDSEAENISKTLKNIWNIISESVNSEKGELGFAGKACLAKFEKSILSAAESLKEMRLRDYGNIVFYNIPNYIKKLKNLASEKEVKAVYNLIIEKWIKMLMPVVPHLAEEAWKMFGKKNFVSLEMWPKVDKKMIDEKLILAENLVDNTVRDIRKIIKIIKKQPQKIYLYISPTWKYEVYKSILSGIKDKKHLVSEIMKNPEIKKQGKDAVRFAEKLYEAVGELPAVSTQNDEYEILKQSINFIKKEVGVDVEIWRANDEKRYDPQNKARHAEPFKPAIFIE